jgi:hypothetical protein
MMLEGYLQNMAASQSNVDKRNRFDEEIFTYQVTKDKKVFLFWYDRRVKTLSGTEAARFLQKIYELDPKEAQLLMAKLTGNFKRGNERRTTGE